MDHKSSVFPWLILFFYNCHTFVMENIRPINDCKTQHLKPWMYFPHDVCIQIIINDTQYPAVCISRLMDQLMTRNDIVVYQKSLDYMTTRNILKEMKTNCESFLLVMKNPEHWINEINQKRNKSQRIFYPFSRLYFLSPNRVDLKFDNSSDYFYQNGLFGYAFLSDANGDVIGIRDIVNNVLLTTSPNFTDMAHPLIDVTSIQNRTLSVSVFNCPPHVFYLNKSGSRKDGLEYRFLMHVLKNWKIKFLQQNESAVPFTPFAGMFGELGRGSSQMVMCGMWLHIQHNSIRDLTSYFDHNCVTWIAPKPKTLDPAKLIYLSLSAPVWGLYGICFIFTSILLTVLSKIEEHIQSTKLISSNFGRSFLEAANIATSHGIVKFPKQLSVQILLLSWILLNLLVGLGYTTVYTSRLTDPGYTKPINTFEDFVDQGVSWISRQEYLTILQELKESSKPVFSNMSKNFVRVNTEQQLIDALNTGRYGMLMSLRSQKYAIDMERLDPNAAVNVWKSLRFMKVCFYSHFTSFVLTKHSPYTALFNAHLRRYQEFGIIKYWYIDLYRSKHWMKTLFESRIQGKKEPTILNLQTLSGAFFILIFGISLAAISCFIEIIYEKLERTFLLNKKVDKRS